MQIQKKKKAIPLSLTDCDLCKLDRPISLMSLFFDSLDNSSTDKMPFSFKERSVAAGRRRKALTFRVQSLELASWEHSSAFLLNIIKNKLHLCNSEYSCVKLSICLKRERFRPLTSRAKPQCTQTTSLSAGRNQHNTPLNWICWSLVSSPLWGLL